MRSRPLVRFWPLLLVLIPAVVTARQVSLRPNLDATGLWMAGASVAPAVRPLSLEGEVWVPRESPDLELKWDVSTIRPATGVIWQVNRTPFPEPDRNDPETLHAFRGLRSGTIRGSRGTLRLPLADLAPRLSVRGNPPRYYVRVVPVAPAPAAPGRRSTGEVATVGQPSPALLVHHGAADCAELPEACCPTRALCAALARSLLEVRIRSYVPPRFSVMGRHEPYGAPNMGWASIVSDIDRADAGVRRGCRFSPVAVTERLRRNMNVWEQFAGLAEATLSQWSEGYRSAKRFVAGAVAEGVCSAARNPSGCRSEVAAWAEKGIEIGLASLGIPPDLPDLDELRRHGVEYLASMAASAAVGQAGAVFEELPLGDRLYESTYRAASDGLARELDRALPRATVDEANPMTWGRIDPAYRPHPAHLYVEVRVREGREATLRRLLRARGADHRWPPLALEDRGGVYAARANIDLPILIPTPGLIVPVQLVPAARPSGADDDARAAIPGMPVSRRWLREKFGLDGTLATAQYNYRPLTSDSYLNSDYDLFYASNGQYHFVLRSRVGAETIVWEENRTGRPGSVWDAVTGSGVRTGAYWERNSQLKRYFGLVEPAPRCDGQPNRVVVY